mgnify:CR=1 FL=1
MAEAVIYSRGVIISSLQWVNCFGAGRWQRTWRVKTDRRLCGQFADSASLVLPAPEGGLDPLRVPDTVEVVTPS